MFLKARSGQAGINAPKPSLKGRRLLSTCRCGIRTPFLSLENDMLAKKASTVPKEASACWGEGAGISGYRKS